MPVVLAERPRSGLLLRRSFAQAPPVHAPDGGTMERIQSIDIPPLPNAPFTATVNTEWTRLLEDGTTTLVRNSRRIARDAQGRVFQERRMFVPGDVSKAALTEIRIFPDPTTHTVFVCDVGQAAHATCFRTTSRPCRRCRQPDETVPPALSASTSARFT